MQEKQEYIDAYVLPVKKDKLEEYRKMAADAGRIWVKHGALKYVEAMGDDLTSVQEWKGREYSEMANMEDGEIVVTAFVVFKSKEDRDRINKLVMEDPEMKCDEDKIPFVLGKMAYGGFETFVNVEQ